MLNKIIHFSLQNRLLILVASVLLLIGGTYTAYHTEVDVFPDLNAPTVVVMTEANGMAAEEVEQLVTFPIETATPLFDRNSGKNTATISTSKDIKSNMFKTILLDFIIPPFLRLKISAVIIYRKKPFCLNYRKSKRRRCQ